MLKDTNFRIQKMRAEIERSGETLLEPGELNQLGETGIPEEQQFKTIAQLAISEGWSFTFLPDDSVRFAKLEVLRIGNAANKSPRRISPAGAPF